MANQNSKDVVDNLVSEKEDAEPKEVVIHVKKAKKPRKTKVEVVVDDNEQENKVVKPEKKKRAPSAYNLFVKEHIGKFKDLAPKLRLSAVAKLYREEKEKKINK
jgi:hypothetical protein